MQGFVDGDIVAHLGQIARTGQARGAGADDGDPVTVGFGLDGSRGAVLIVEIRHKALQTADADRIALDAAHTVLLALALLRAHTAADGGKGAVLRDDLIGFLEVAFRYLLDEFRDLDIDGAACHTGMILAV